MLQLNCNIHDVLEVKMESIGSIIKKYRTKSGLTQDELGKKLFTSKQTVSKWENGISLPNIETLRKLGNLLNIPNAEIMQKHNEFCNERIDSDICPPENNGQKNEADIEQWRDFKLPRFGVDFGQERSWRNSWLELWSC